MNAVYYQAVRPSYSHDRIPNSAAACSPNSICGTDSHVHEGEFIAKFPLIPGHEVIGVVEKVGKGVEGFAKGDRCVADPSSVCERCFYCRRGQPLLCEDYNGKGVTTAGGFAEYIVFSAAKVYKIHNLTDEEATLVEPAACAIHGVDKLAAPVGIEALVIGAGPTGLILAQLLKLNGAARVVVAANRGIKTRIAQELGAADEYVELDREAPEAQWARIREENPYGFDVVVEATGSEKVANDSINYVRRGGTLMVYGVYANSAQVHWAPSKIFGDEIRIIGSFAQMHCFPRAVQYLDSGKIKVKGMVTDVFKIDEYQKALDKMSSRDALKIVVKP
ncbi:GroES-like protein [Coniophora puteana RWD-64-598 SS2]|uniref:GroES-like protein n=1 Tax=Coniophora puteana (strain RWD-64-598) TaxID=741705 RepID=A0A5M3MDZ4_CONPW|nr:GroES-like protein [Coniophora puteana RWD-64-598 SS2]EIW77216.1 GroES-like protein [Coniophora puteana RWD-64-598 SS2]